MPKSLENANSEKKKYIVIRCQIQILPDEDFKDFLPAILFQFRPVMTLRVLQEASFMTAFGEPGCRELATFASQVEMEGQLGMGILLGI